MLLITSKGMFISESVKAKLNGQHSCPALTDSTLNMASRYDKYHWNKLSIFYNQTQFNELSPLDTFNLEYFEWV